MAVLIRVTCTQLINYPRSPIIGRSWQGGFYKKVPALFEAARHGDELVSGKSIIHSCYVLWVD